MKYPETFITLCKEVYPTWIELHEFLNRGSCNMVGKLLENALGFPLDEDLVIKLFRNGKQGEILNAAIYAKKKRKVFNEYLKVHDTFIESNEGEF